ncbi:MAG: hypothetical protein K2J26_00700 [Ruminococcus sp.]|nr:hypothetical protein [Ruminococcus sp.]
MLFASLLPMAAEAAAGWNSITSDMLLDGLSEIKSLLPIVGPAVVGFIGFRKGWGFVKGNIKGA